MHSLLGPASEDWCEKNYEVTPYIAEFYNTLSSLPIIATGVLGLFFGVQQRYRRRFLAPSFFLILVGLGSVLFHATLTYIGQALDELTMVWMALTCVYLGFELDPRAVRRPWLAPTLVAWGAAFSVAYFSLRGSVYFWFFVAVFAVLSTQCCYKALQLHWCTTDPALRRLFYCGQALWAFSFLALWAPDKFFCAIFQPLHLHAIFHLTSCTAVSWYLAHRAYAFYSVEYQLKTGMEARADGGLAPGRPEVLALLAAGATAPVLDCQWVDGVPSPGSGSSESAAAQPAAGPPPTLQAGKPPMLHWLFLGLLPYAQRFKA